jgi:hypothetical protein
MRQDTKGKDKEKSVVALCCAVLCCAVLSLQRPCHQWLYHIRPCTWAAFPLTSTSHLTLVVLCRDNGNSDSREIMKRYVNSPPNTIARTNTNPVAPQGQREGKRKIQNRAGKKASGAVKVDKDSARRSVLGESLGQSGQKLIARGE